jgi:hypothetical protein
MTLVQAGGRGSYVLKRSDQVGPQDATEHLDSSAAPYAVLAAIRASIGELAAALKDSTSSLQAGLVGSVSVFGESAAIMRDIVAGAYWTSGISAAQSVMSQFIADALSTPSPARESSSHQSSISATLGTLKATPQQTPAPIALIKRTLDLMDLPRGWDGRDASPVSPSAALAAIRLLNFYYARAHSEGRAISRPQIGPAPDGSVQLEWDIPPGFLAIGIEPTGVRSLYYRVRDGGELLIDDATDTDIWSAVSDITG